MKKLILSIFVLFSVLVNAQSIITSSNGSYNQCSGTFYDSGGPLSDYTPGDAYTVTIYPSGPGRQVSITFTSFDMGNSLDELIVYDGNSTAAPIVDTYEMFNAPLIGSTFVSTAADGSITFAFSSNAFLSAGAGWAVNIACQVDCQQVVADLVSTTPAAVGGYIDICQGETVSFNGSATYPNNNFAYAQSNGTSSFTWDFSGGLANETGTSASKTFPDGGGYDVNLIVEDVNGCDSDNDLGLRIRVSTTPTFVTAGPDDNPVCAGQTTGIGGVAEVQPTYWETPINNTVAGTTFLPDGSGASYTTQITVDDFDLGRTVATVNDISEICMNIEHSYVGDLDVWIECPDAVKVQLFDGSGGAWLGTPVDNDSDLSPGTGADYCFAPGATGTLRDAGTAAGTGNSIPSGTYESDENMSALVGCNLNGDWTIEVKDNIGSDNGYIFSWQINFDASLYTIWNFTPDPQTNTDADISWTGENIVLGPPITATPVTAPSQNYTMTYTDEYGCVYDTTFTIDVTQSPIIDDPGAQTACDAYTFPTITGTDLTGNEAYYTGTGGTGTSYSAGQTWTTLGTTTLYIYDAQVGAPFCTNEVSFDVTINTGPTFTVTPANPSACSGTDGTLTINGLNATTTYDITYTDDGVVVGPASLTTDGSGQIVINGLDAGSYTDVIAELAGCATTEVGPYALNDPNGPVFTVAGTNPTACTATDGFLTLSGLTATTTYTVSYSDDGTPVAAAPMTTDGAGEIVINTLDAGDYTDVTVELTGCSTTDGGTYTLSDPASPTFTVTKTDITACGADDGILLIEGLTATTAYDINYSFNATPVGVASMTTNGAGEISLSPLAVGSYTDISVDLAGCVTTDAGPYTFADPASPTYTVTTSNPTTCLGTEGTITLSGLTATTNYDVTYTDDGTPVGPAVFTTDGSGDLVINTLDAGSYADITVSITNCPTIEAGPYTLTDPSAPVFTSAGSDPTTCAGTEGTITLSGLTATTTYNVTYTDDGTPVGPAAFTTDGAGDLVINTLNAGSYTDITVELNSCSTIDAGPVALTDPNGPPFTASTNPVTTCGGNEGEIILSGLVVGDVYSVDYTDGVTPVGPVSLTADASGNVTIIGLTPATYTVNIADPGNCSSTGTATVNDNSIAPAADAGADMIITCTNPTLTLDGTASEQGAGVTYAWTTPDGTIDADNTTDSPVVSAAGTYTITVTANGCTSTDNVVVTEDNTPPVANAGADLQLDCTNLTHTLDGSASDQGAFDTHSWTTPDGNIVSGNTTINPIVDQPGSYTITVTNTNNGCFATDVMAVTLDNTVPTAAAGIDLIIDCSTTTATIDGSTSSSGVGIDYAWTTVGGNITSAANIATITADAAGTYTLTVTNTNNGCVATDDADVTLNAVLPVVDAGADALINCTTPSMALDGSLSASGVGITYLWSTVGGNIVSGGTSTAPTIDAAGTYTLTVSDASNGCSDSDDVIITDDFTAPTAEAGPGQLITCLATTVGLDGTGSSTGANFTYGWSGGNVVSGGTTIMPTVDQATTYTITVTDITNGCTATDDVVVAADAGLPNADAGSDQDITCVVTSVTLDGSASETGGTITYSWATPDGNITSATNVPTITADASGTYTITVTNTATSCVSTDDVIVNLNNTPPVANAGPDMVIDCANPTVDLDGSSSYASGTYAWTTGIGTIDAGTTTNTATVSAIGNYVITVTDPVTGCTNTDDADVTDNLAAPTAVANTPGDLTCTVTSLVLDGTGSTTTGLIGYNWTTVGGNVFSNGNTLTPTIDAAGTYTITVTDASNGCTATADVTVVLDNTAPTADAGATVQIDCTNPTVNLDGSGSSTVGTYTYLWSTADGSITLNTTTLAPTVDAPGTYDITVTNGTNGCTATSSVVVTESTTIPTADAGSTGQIDCVTANITLDGSASDAGMNYNWTTLDGSIVSGTTTTAPVVDQGGTYTITVTNPLNGCAQTASVLIDEDINIPNAFAGSTATVTCSNPTITLNGAGSSAGADYTYNWTTLDGTIVSDATTLTPVVNQGGTYTITVTNIVNSCTNTADVLISQNTTDPTADAGLPVEITCINSTVTLDGTGSTAGALGYAWSTIDGGSISGSTTMTATVTQGGTYTIRVTDPVNGCFQESSVLVSENTTPPSADAGFDVEISCVNEFQTLGGPGTTASGATYDWEVNGVTYPTLSNNFITTVNEAGIYKLIVTDNVNGCTDEDEVIVTGDLERPDLIVTRTVSVCENISNIDLSNKVSIMGGTWAGTTDVNSAVIDLSAGPGEYLAEYTVEDADNFCTTTKEIIITVNSNPLIIANGGGVNCVGDSVLITVDGADTYLWEEPAGAVANSFYYPVTPGESLLSVVGTNSLTGCVNSATLTVEGINPSVSISGLNPTTEYPYYAELTAIANDVDSYEWYNNGELITEEERMYYVFGQGENVLTLMGEDTYSGCRDTVEMTFELLDPSNVFVPSVFSPNGDGVNDVFRIGAVFMSAELQIFNRWGNLVYSEVSPSPSWDGEDLADVVSQEDVYMYRLTATLSTGETFNKIGQISLIR